MNSRRKFDSGWVLISGAAVIGCTGFGAWWTAVAVYEGEVGAMFFRFFISILGGSYYAVLRQVARGGELDFGFQESGDRRYKR